MNARDVLALSRRASSARRAEPAPTTWGGSDTDASRKRRTRRAACSAIKIATETQTKPVATVGPRPGWGTSIRHHVVAAVATSVDRKSTHALDTAAKVTTHAVTALAVDAAFEVH